MFTLFYFLVSLSCLELTPSFSLFFLRSFALPLSPFVFPFLLFISFPYFLFFSTFYILLACGLAPPFFFIRPPPLSLSPNIYRLSPFRTSLFILSPSSSVYSCVSLPPLLFLIPFSPRLSFILPPYFSISRISPPVLLPPCLVDSSCQPVNHFSPGISSPVLPEVLSLCQKEVSGFFFLDFVSIYTCMCE